MKVLFVVAEAAPFAKTGGLADVAGALPKALARLGHDVRCAMPRYRRISPSQFKLSTEIAELDVPVDQDYEKAAVLRGILGDHVPVYFIDCPKYFDREGIYCYADDGERFVTFSRAVMETIKKLEWRPDIIHCNDWHTAIIPNWVATIYKDDPFFAHTATVYTIHNLAYQGVFGVQMLKFAGIQEFGFLPRPEMGELNQVVDLMCRGIHYADVVSTVSETYAKEILTPEFGERMDATLKEREERVFGIVNGIDYGEFNPATDPNIVANFDRERLEKRAENKRALQKEANLPAEPEVPLIGMVSRLTDQKGVDLLEGVLDHILNLELQFVLLGTGEQHYHDVFNRLAQSYSGKVAVFLTFNAPLAQRIYAGADMFLMPSRFEPCGLSQLIAMRYGCVPIVRKTGGLADTVQDFDPRAGEGTGFVFTHYDRWELFAAVVRAIETHRHREIWRRLQKRCMAQDFGWGVSAKKYVELYRKALKFKRREAKGPSA